jgi:translation initiation factor 3 subunit H
MSDKKQTTQIQWSFDPVSKIKLDGKVALKVIQHSRDNIPTMVWGQLLGLARDGVMEITDCFAIPQRSEEDGDSNDYTFEMMKCLREVNVDCNIVSLGKFCVQPVITFN